MFERYLLSTLASKLGHIFKDFDENTTAELHAWRGVLVLRNLHLRKDALIQLGIPPLDSDDFDDADDGSIFGDGDNLYDDNDDDGSSCDDSFQSCASHITEDDDDDDDDVYTQAKESLPANPPTNNSSTAYQRHGPTIEVAYGYIGSLEFHIPWPLLSPTRSPGSSNDARDKEDFNLKCSAVLSDVRILLAPSNQTRNQSKFGRCSHNQLPRRRDPQDCSSTRKSNIKLSVDEKLQQQRELAVQSLLEREIFRYFRVVNKEDDKDASTETWLARRVKELSSRILSSLHVTMHNIHIRYEDEGYGWFEQDSRRRFQYRPSFAMGIHLVDFALRNANANEDTPCDTSDNSDGQLISATSILRRKIANVDKMSVYWDSHHTDLFIGYTTDEDDREYYEKRFVELDILYSDEFQDAPQQHTYLIQPISPSLKLTMVDLRNNEKDLQRSQFMSSIHINFCIPSFHIGFDRNTLEDVAYVRRCLSTYKARIVSSKHRVIEQFISEQILKIRPQSDFRPRDNPRIWWRYAIRAVKLLQSDRSHFNGKISDNDREWRRDRWLSLAHLLLLRNEYIALYVAFMRAPPDIAQSKKIHANLLTLEDQLRVEEIAAFRIAVIKKLFQLESDLSSYGTLADPDASDHYEPSNSFPALSLEYRGAKMHQIIQSINLDNDLFIVEDGLKPLVEADNWRCDRASPIFSVSMDFQDLTAQANDNFQTPPLRHVSTQQEQAGIVPIVRLHCRQSLRFEKQSSGSWTVTAELSSLSLFDLISPVMKKTSEQHSLIRMKKLTIGDCDKLDTADTDNTAKVTIRNTISDEATAHETLVDVRVSPLAFTYSTLAFEALSRLCVAINTNEFSRDYERITRALSRWKSRQKELLISVLSRRRKKLVVSIDIAAPVLHIPQDLQNTESPTLVINLGQLIFQSDSNEPPPNGFDDKWLLQVDNISAHSLHSLSHAIIEPFSLNFSIVSHIAEGGPSTINKTRIHVQAVLPQLRFNLRTSSARLVTSLQKSWNNSKLRHRTLPQRQTVHDFLLMKDSSQWKTNRTIFSGAIHNDVISSNVIASEAVQEIEFAYSASTISLCIGNDVNFDQPTVEPSCLIPLINLSIIGICGNCISHSSEAGGVAVQISARLRSVYAEDIQQPITKLRLFISSIDPTSIDDESIPGVTCCDEDLVIIKISKNPKEDKDISIRFHELYVNWNPEMLSRVQKSLRPPQQSMSSFLNCQKDASVYFDAIDDYTSYTDEIYEKAETLDVAHQHHAIPTSDTAKSRSPLFNVAFHLAKLRMNFNKDSQNRCLFRVDVNQTDVLHCRKPLGGVVTTVTVANARLRDPGEVSGGTLYGQMIGIESGTFSSPPEPTSSIVHMSFESFTRQPNLDSEFHSFLDLKFSVMKFVYIHQFWLEIFDYIFEGILGHAVWGSKPKSVAQAFKRTKMSIQMEQPLFLLPICYRSPHHIRLKMNSLAITNHFTEGIKGIQTQWFNNVQVIFRDLIIFSWDERNLNNTNEVQSPPSMTMSIRWPVGPTAMQIKPKWNVTGHVDPVGFCLTRRDFSLFRFIVSHNFLESSRCIVGHASPGDESKKLATQVLFGYEKIGGPPTTYSLNFTFSTLIFQLFLDEEESDNKTIEGMMNVVCSNAAWSLLKNVDCISTQNVIVDSICLTQASNRVEWGGFPDLLLPNTLRVDQTTPQHRLFQFNSITHPNGNSVKTLQLDAAQIYLIVPAWQHVARFFQQLAVEPEIFTSEEMTSIMQVGDRFYRLSSRNGQTALSTDPPQASDHQSAVSRQFVVTLMSPQITIVSDATVQGKKSPCLRISIAHLNILRQTTIQKENHYVFCDGFEICTDTSGGRLPLSSILFPVLISGSLTNSFSCFPRIVSGWVWVEQLKAHAAYTDLTRVIEVLNGVKEQSATGITSSFNADEENRTALDRRINIDVLCDQFNLEITDDSRRQFVNNQPLVAVMLSGVRFSRFAVNRKGIQQAQVPLSPGQRLIQNNLVTIDSLEILDLLQQDDSPFRIMTASSQDNSKPGMFSFSPQVELEKMSWQSHHVIASSDWGFQVPHGMKIRQEAVLQLPSPNSYFDSSIQHRQFLALNTAFYDNGSHSINTNVRHFTIQWNPSTIIASQRFLGRLKKALHSFLTTTEANGATAIPGGSKKVDPPPKTCTLFFSLNANIESINIYLNKEYQQRRLLDVFLSGAMIKFERYNDQSLQFQASVQKLRAWDPDLSRPTSDRNRHLLRQIQDTHGNFSSDPFFSFHYRTFKSSPIRISEQLTFADWVTISEDIDDILSVKSSPFEFVYCRDTVSELADYLSNGFPGKGMGTTSQAAKSFCASRIRARSFFDFTFDRPCIFIPRAPSSLSGGCHLTLGAVRVKSWFEEVYAPRDETHQMFAYSPSFSSEDYETMDKLDWWRVLDIDLCIGIKIEVNEPFVGILSEKDIVFHANLIARKPSSAEMTIIQCRLTSLDIHLKYTEFLMLNLVAAENIGQHIDESKWDWQNEGDEFSLVYAETARFVRFGETKTAIAKEWVIHVGFVIDSINVTLHRDDLNEENSFLLCYDICQVSVRKMVMTMAMQRNGYKSASVAVYDLSFADVGDCGRMARDLYMGSNDPKRPCAFSLVAEGYGQSSDEPIVLLIIGRQTSICDDTKDEAVKNIDLKVNSLSVTVLPRSIEEVLGFVSKKWISRNSNLDMMGVATQSKSPKMMKDVTMSANNTLRFKFVAVYPRLILLADETDPYSRALVLSGLAVGNMSTCHDSSSYMQKYGQLDIRTTTSLSGHIKELETYVHNNVDMLIGPNRAVSDDSTVGTALVEPVTVTVEVRIESRSRFPTLSFASVDIDPVAILLSFGDLNLIDNILRKSFRRQDKSKLKELEPQNHILSPSASSQVYSPQFSNSSDYSQCEERQLIFDVAIPTKKLGLKLRKSGSSIIVVSSESNNKVNPGDVLLSVNGQSVERMPLSSVVEMFDFIPRPLTIKLSRKGMNSDGTVHHQSSAINSSSYTTLNSFSFISRSDEVYNDVAEADISNPILNNTSRFDVKICGMPFGLELISGLGGSATVNNIDYDLFARCAQSSAIPNDLASMTSLIASRQLPLPGAILLAVDGIEMNFEEISHLFERREISQDLSYTLSFVEVYSMRNLNFEGKGSLVLTVIDDTNGRDMPVLRAGLNDTSVVACHGLAVSTKSIVARRPSILSLHRQGSEEDEAVISVDSKVSSFSLDFNNALVNEWEPLIEPHYLTAMIERQRGNSLVPGQCSFIARDQIDHSEHDPLDFVCINVSDSAVSMLSTAANNWSKRKNPNNPVGSPPTPPRTIPSPNLLSTQECLSAASVTELRKAAKLAKVALNFSKKRGNAYTDPAKELAPFMFKNRLGIQVRFSASGISSTVIDDGQNTQFNMHPIRSRIKNTDSFKRQKDRRIRMYDGQFPTINVELCFSNLETVCSIAETSCKGVHADPIIDLPTGKLGSTLRSIRTMKKKVSRQVHIFWEVRLEENRRVLILSSATKIKVFGCVPAIEVGARFGRDSNGEVSDDTTIIGTISQEETFHVPLWVESCFCSVDIFVRPLLNLGGSPVYEWSAFPVLCLKTNVDTTEINYNRVADMALTSGGIRCSLRKTDDNHPFFPVWLPCTFSSDHRLKNSTGTSFSSSQHAKYTPTTVTIWSAITIRNMLPCVVEWEVSSSLKDGPCSILDSSLIRAEQHRQTSTSAELDSSSPNSSLHCGNTVEIFTRNAFERDLHARFKCIARNTCYWSDWVSVVLLDDTFPTLINLRCSNSSCIGVKLSPRLHDGPGVTLVLYAELWLRNLTSIPLTFGAPSFQVGSERQMESNLPAMVSADSALLEITSVLDGNSFGIFGNDDIDEDDLGDDIINLPVQQCKEVYEEVFEYLSLNERGNVERRWWASENHVSLRKNPYEDETDKAHWLVDCAGEPLLLSGWESCSNIAGSRSSTFNGRRLFNKQHRFRRRRWFRVIRVDDDGTDKNESTTDIIFHQPADLDRHARAKREAERNAIGVQLDAKKEAIPNLMDVFTRSSRDEGVLDIMTRVANDGSILVYVKVKDGKWSTPAIIPPSGSSFGVIRLCSSRWPLVTRAIKEQRRKENVRGDTDGSNVNNLGIAPLEPTVYELIYQVNVISGIWGELSRMVTIIPRFLIVNESSWLDIDIKQAGAPDASRLLLRKGDTLPFHWFDTTLPELICVRPTQSRHRFNWSGGFDVCTLGMIAIRVRRIDGSIDQLNLRSMRVNIELQPGSGGSGTIVSIRDEDPVGEGSLFRIENHTPFQVFVSQEGVLANPVSTMNGAPALCDVLQPGERTSYALDVPWRQGKYVGRTSASMSELLLLRCALAPLSTREGVESTKVISFARVGDYIRLSPSKLSSSIGSVAATELLGVRVLGVVSTDGSTRTLRFILMQKEVSATSYIGNAVRDTISPMPSFMSTDSKPHVNDNSRAQVLLHATSNTLQLFTTGYLPSESEAIKHAFFGTGVCKRSNLMLDEANKNSRERSHEIGDDISCELLFSGFLFSFIDSSPTELAVLSLHNVKVGASWSSSWKDYLRGRVSITWLQLDNHCPNSPYPVAIRPRVKAEWESKDGYDKIKKAFTAEKPFIEVVIDLAPPHRTGIQSLSAGACLHDVEVFADLAFILRIQRFLLCLHSHIMDAAGSKALDFLDSQRVWELPNVDRITKRNVGKMFYHFHRLTILPFELKLSVAPARALSQHQEEFEGTEASAIHAAVRKGDVLVGDGTGVIGVKIGSKNRTVVSVVQGMMKSILVDALLRCDGASLNFEGVALSNHTSNSLQLMTYLGAHYLASLIGNVPSLIGSLAAFGNPLGLIRDLGDGVSDFVNEPARGLKRSIEELDPSFVMTGLARGTESLARHALGGFADSAALLTETAAKQMAVLTLDRKYAQRRDRVMKFKATDAQGASILKGLESGIQKLVNGIQEGVTGVVFKPIRGAERNGFEGFAKGVGKGLLGLIMKPVIGTTDLLTDTLMGVKGSVEDASSEMILMHSQVRPRRALYGQDRVVKPYRLDDATAATIQAALCIGGEEYYSHVDMINKVALLSVSRLLILSEDGNELLLLPYSEIRCVEVQPEIKVAGFLVKIYVHESDECKIFVKCDEESIANLLCEKLNQVISIKSNTDSIMY